MVQEVATCMRTEYGDMEANARRIVACVNACAGLSTALLENITMLGDTLKDRIDVLRNEANQRDELLEVLEGLIDEVAGCMCTYEMPGPRRHPESEGWGVLSQQQIIALAVEAGMSEIVGPIGALTDSEIARLNRFAALVAHQERNACLAEIETGIWMDKTTEEVLADIAEAIRARSAEPKQLSGWHRAVDEEMVLTHLGVANPSDSYETAKKKLNDLIAWHVAVATAPAVNGWYVLVRQDSATIPPSSTTE